MAITTPTTAATRDLIVASIEASLNQTVLPLPKSFIRVLAMAVAGLLVILYKYGGTIHLNQFISSASTVATVINGRTLIPLVEWGRQLGVGDPAAATAAELDITVTVETQTGSLQAGSQLQAASNGLLYISLQAVLLDAATVTVPVRCTTAGAVGNLEAGAELSFANPLSNVARLAVVAAQTTTGANGEDFEDYRARVQDRFQKTPQGGAPADYEQWGETVAGIVNVYPYKGLPGQVDVYSEATEASSGSADGIPTQAQLDAVAAAIQFEDNGLASRRPIGSFVNSLAISRQAFDVDVLGLEVDDVATTHSDILNALTDYFLAAEPFIQGLTLGVRSDRLTTASIGGVVNDVVVANGGTFTAARFSLAGSAVPIAIHQLAAGQKAKLGALTVNGTAVSP